MLLISPSTAALVLAVLTVFGNSAGGFHHDQKKVFALQMHSSLLPRDRVWHGTIESVQRLGKMGSTPQLRLRVRLGNRQPSERLGRETVIVQLGSYTDWSTLPDLRRGTFVVVDGLKVVKDRRVVIFAFHIKRVGKC